MKPNWITTLIVAALIGIAATRRCSLRPPSAPLGLIQRIFYFHVPSAWAGFVAFFITFIASVAYLLRRAPKWDCWRCPRRVGVAFFTVVLVTRPSGLSRSGASGGPGMPRLTSTFVLWCSTLVPAVAHAGHGRRAPRSGVSRVRHLCVSGCARWCTCPSDGGGRSTPSQ